MLVLKIYGELVSSHNEYIYKTFGLFPSYFHLDTSLPSLLQVKEFFNYSVSFRCHIKHMCVCNTHITRWDTHKYI